MDQGLRQALLSCAIAAVDERTKGRFALIVPWSLSNAEIDSIPRSGRIVGVACRDPAAALLRSTAGWLSSWAPGAPVNVGPGAHIVFAGPVQMLNLRFLFGAFLRGHIWLTGDAGGQMHRFTVPGLLLRLWKSRILHVLRRPTEKSAVRRLVEWTRRVPVFTALWHGLLGERETGSGVGEGETVLEGRLRSYLGGMARPPADSVAGPIVMVNAGLPAGGAERQILETVSGLKQNGVHEVTFLGLMLGRRRGAEFFAPALRETGCTVVAVHDAFRPVRDALAGESPEQAAVLSCLPADVLHDVMNFRAEFRARRPRIVHAWQDAMAATAGLAAVIEGVPRVVLSFRNVAPPVRGMTDPYLAVVLRALADMPNVVLAANSRAGCETYSEWLGLPRDRLHLIPNAVSLRELEEISERRVAARRELGIPENARVVGGVFRAHPDKRPGLWADVVQLVSQSLDDVHIVYIGYGPLSAELSARCRKLLGSRYHHLPPTGSVTDLYLAFDVLLHTSEFDGLSNVILEAQAAGIPVVATEAGDVRHGVDDGQSGVICASSRPEDIAQDVLVYLQNPERGREAGARGQAFIAGHYSRDAMLDATLELYAVSLESDASK